uniref:Serotransferrin n=1 Tax=Mastacembelus armatus TaxID=205130 RepID=A0A7N8YNV2_9TELE
LICIVFNLSSSTATMFAAPAEKVKWCVKSEPEYRKCLDLAAKAPAFSCVRRDNTIDCIIAIKASEADAITLDGGDIYTAGLNNYDLHPIIAEDYGPNYSDTCYLAVAVAKKGTLFGFKDLRGKKSCHTGLGKSAGWNIPIGTLVSMGIIQWGGIEDKPVEEGALKVFFKHMSFSGAGKILLSQAEWSKYELLCKDNTRAPMSMYESCNLARVPAHAVVTRKDSQLAELIWTSLNSVQVKCYGPSKNLIFKDSTQRLVQLPPNTDSFLYLGAEYMSVIRSLKKEQATATASTAIKWCAVGHAETAKCDTWSISVGDDSASIECQNAPTVEECLKKIMRKEADAVAVDGGQVYTAGKCGLVPAMVEQYDSAKSSKYLAVAVVKKGSGVTWDTLKGKRSCHTGIGRTAGWNIPMGHIHNLTNDCDFTKFFSSGCAPGADPSSPFCSQCIGSGKAVGDESKCKASADEQYYGYAGAFRCLVDGAGDVAFVKHTIVQENSDGNGPEWAKGVNSADYELICPGKGPVPVTDFASCNLAEVPAHAVMTRPENRGEVVRILQEQQAKFGPTGSDASFRLFQSEQGKNLLFKDSTKCLQEIPVGTNYEKFLQHQYILAMNSLRQCSETAPDLEKSCTFHNCQPKN